MTVKKKKRAGTCGQSAGRVVGEGLSQAFKKYSLVRSVIILGGGMDEGMEVGQVRG